MKLTEKQQSVLNTLREVSRENVFRYKDKTPYLYECDLKKLAAGDDKCAFGLGGLTFQVGHRLGLEAGVVLSVFRSLERKGLVLREASFPEYHRPRYWWPVGFSAQLLSEIEDAA